MPPPPKVQDFRLDEDTPFLQNCLKLARVRRLTKLSPLGPKHKAWGVQLAFWRTKSETKAEVARLRSSCRALVKSEKTHYLSIKSRVQGKPAYFTARIGQNTKDLATTPCRKIGSRGCSCKVYKNKVD